MRYGKTMLSLGAIILAWGVATLAGAATAPVTLAVAQQDGHDVVRIENYRFQLTIDPTRGGAVTSYSDKLAPAELILQKPYSGLCMDHFQEQTWPGEFLEQPYEYKVLQQTPEIAQVMVWRKSTGVWGNKVVNPKISDILLEKTYTVNADSPTLTVSVKLTMPADQPKVFSYWMQDVMFAGGDYDSGTDRTFRPSARGVRSTGYTNNGHYGTEEWMRDFNAGWMALLDTKKKSGLAMWTDYNELRINYANGGNMTNEFMFNTTYLPKGNSRTYTVLLTPIVGLDEVLYVGPEMVAGYQIKPTAGTRNGTLSFSVVRGAQQVNDMQLAVSLASATDTTKEVKVGAVGFGPLTDQVQTKTLTYTGAPPDPLLVRVAAKGLETGDKTFAATAEDFFPGAYQWADNIMTDMRTPVYAAPRPPQTLSLSKPAKLALTLPYGDHYLFFEGLQDDIYNVAGAVHASHYEPKTEPIYYSYSGSWYGSLSDFPYDYDKLLSFHAVILGGISKSGLKPIGLEMLHDYLMAGGGLVVLGSHGAYGRSQLKGTALGDAFPVEMGDSVFDMVATGGKPIVAGPDSNPFLKYTPLGANATCYFLHDVKVKPGAQVLLQVDGKPFLVTSEYGPNKARIVCVLGAPLGKPAAGQVAFWQDPDWYLVLRNALWWVGKRPYFEVGN
ncbi:MAG TPA: hypothetical protein VGM19_15005 [Armatimonadota bacterium]|jgi:uncharacterized membrane protein